MNIAALKTELLAGHPDTGAYKADDATATAQLNAVNRTTNKTSMIASDVYNAIDQTEWLALTDAKRQEIWDILHLGEINPYGLEATRFTSIFGGASDTVTTLKSVRKNNVSRAVELGLGFVFQGHVENARI